MFLCKDLFMNTIYMQKIKNGIVGCIVLMSIAGHNAVQGMKRKSDICPFLLELAEKEVCQFKRVRTDKGMEVEPARQPKVVTFMEPVVTAAIKIPKREAPKIKFVDNNVLGEAVNGRYNCTQCKYSTACKKWLPSHYRMHTLQNDSAATVYYCSTCHYLNCHKKAFKEHQQTHRDREKKS
jgi:hypothetical protein